MRLVGHFPSHAGPCSNSRRPEFTVRYPLVHSGGRRGAGGRRPDAPGATGGAPRRRGARPGERGRGPRGRGCVAQSSPSRRRRFTPGGTAGRAAPAGWRCGCRTVCTGARPDTLSDRAGHGPPEHRHRGGRPRGAPSLRARAARAPTV